MKYLNRSIGQVLSLYALTYGVLVIVFAIEQFDAILRKALEYNASLPGFLKLFAFTLPEVADFIVPVSVLVSVYLVLLYKRENREFLILAAGGSDLRPVVLLVLAVSILFFTLSVAISGYLKPAAAHAYRAERLNAVAGFVSEGPRNGRFTRDRDRVFHVTDRNSAGLRAVRIFDFDQERLSRMMVSDCSNLAVSRGSLAINLCAARIYDFATPPPGSRSQADGAGEPCRFCANAAGNLDLTVIDIGRSTVLFPLDTVTDEPLGLRSNERNLHQLLVVDGEWKIASQRGFRDAAVMILLALASILAAAVAVAAVAVTNYRNRFVVLPGAIAFVMLTSVAAGSGFAVPDLRPGIAGFALVCALMLSACLATIPLAFSAMRSRILMPGLGRS
ncbi:LptF/LptG family permease [Zhengella sp. ZM62]|uniref:LptF/LptG family permease n=1 Tax=Zhengella sedimenti TaxID=3390035 RepID=UPI003975A4E6